MSAVLSFLEVPHRDRFAPHVRRALCLLDRVADGEDVSREAVERALRVTGDLDGSRLAHRLRLVTSAEER
jgi:hypothetical protein